MFVVLAAFLGITVGYILRHYEDLHYPVLLLKFMNPEDEWDWYCRVMFDLGRYWYWFLSSKGYPWWYPTEILWLSLATVRLYHPVAAFCGRVSVLLLLITKSREFLSYLCFWFRWWVCGLWNITYKIWQVIQRNRTVLLRDSRQSAVEFLSHVFFAPYYFIRFGPRFTYIFMHHLCLNLAGVLRTLAENDIPITVPKSMRQDSELRLSARLKAGSAQDTPKSNKTTRKMSGKNVTPVKSNKEYGSTKLGTSPSQSGSGKRKGKGTTR